MQLLVSFFITLVFFSVSFSQESKYYDFCDATAKILVKCMVEPDCTVAVYQLKLSLQKTDLPAYDKTKLLEYCQIECNKGKVLKSKQALESAVSGEYKAILTRCIEHFKRRGTGF